MSSRKKKLSDCRFQPKYLSAFCEDESIEVQSEHVQNGTAHEAAGKQANGCGSEPVQGLPFGIALIMAPEKQVETAKDVGAAVTIAGPALIVGAAVLIDGVGLSQIIRSYESGLRTGTAQRVVAWHYLKILKKPHASWFEMIAKFVCADRILELMADVAGIAGPEQTVRATRWKELLSETTLTTTTTDNDNFYRGTSDAGRQREAAKILETAKRAGVELIARTAQIAGAQLLANLAGFVDAGVLAHVQRFAPRALTIEIAQRTGEELFAEIAVRFVKTAPLEFAAVTEGRNRSRKSAHPKRCTVPTLRMDQSAGTFDGTTPFLAAVSTTPSTGPVKHSANSEIGFPISQAATMFRTTYLMKASESFVRSAVPGRQPVEPNCQACQHNSLPDQPNFYPSQPDSYPDQPSPHHLSQPISCPNLQNSCLCQANSYLGQPSSYQGQPNFYPDQPISYPGLPNSYPGPLDSHPGKPSSHSGQPDSYSSQSSSKADKLKITAKRSVRRRTGDKSSATCTTAHNTSLKPHDFLAVSSGNENVFSYCPQRMLESNGEPHRIV